MSDFWDAIKGATTNVVTAVAQGAANSFSKADELRDELAYYQGTGQAVPANGYVSSTGTRTAGSAAPSTGSGFQLTTAWIVGGLLAVGLVLLLVFGRRK